MLFLVLFPILALGQIRFDQFFEHKTLRFDYYHAGTKSDESIIPANFIQYEYYAGNPDRTIDNLNRGYYLVKVFDAKTNQLIFSRGFSSMFNEWQTTGEAASGHKKVIHETVLLPFPKDEIIIEFWKRDKKNRFTELIETLSFSPQSPWIKQDLGKTGFKVKSLMKHGNPESHVDIAIIGDGYTEQETAKFFADAEKYNQIMFNIEPFKSKKKKFNVTAILNPSGESGIDMPDSGKWVDNSLDCHFFTFGSPRYVLTYSNEKVRNTAGTVPYDFIIILANSSRYGGGGIYHLMAVTTADNKYSDYVYVHEFGHSFGGLGDEYYTSSVAYTDFYPQGTEPWEPNVTALLDPEHIKWKSFLTPGILIPTPWEKAKFDSLSLINRNQAQKELVNDPYFGKVGAMEGAGYSSRGLYRPSVDCIMFSKGLDMGFDPVCAQGIIDVIDLYTK